jgi:serine/threonine protein kinase
MAVEVDQGNYDKLIGQVLANRYQIEVRLGEGAMGAVYRAKHVKVGRAFAVKVLHSRLLMDDKVLQRFEREAELAGRLSHTNVVSVVDVGTTEPGLRYLAMELAPGVNLATILVDGPLSESRMLVLTKQLCAGLAHAHEVGLIHRDFKPENVIVEQQRGGREIARIVDFGVAVLREDVETATEHDRLTTKGIVVGTPHYMAPEQACAEPLDHRVDIFALGLICYEMLTGKLPFDGTGAEVVRANLTEPVPPMAVRAPGVSIDPELEAIVMRMLAKHRDDRPENAQVVREMLEAYELRPARAVSMPVVEVPVVQERALTTDKIERIENKRRTPWWLAIPAAGLLALLVPSHEVAGAPNLDVETSDVTPSTTCQHRVYETAAPTTSALPVQSIMKLPPRVEQPAIPAASASEVAQLYARVGRMLKAYERDRGMEATIDYWPRYRWIRINEAIATPEKRNETFKMLSRLRRDLDTGR